MPIKISGTVEVVCNQDVAIIANDLGGDLYSLMFADSKYLTTDGESSTLPKEKIAVSIVLNSESLQTLSEIILNVKAK